MGKLIFNAQSTPVAPVGATKHTMYVDCDDGKLKMEDSNGCVDTILCYTEPTPDYVIASYIVVGGGGGGGAGGLAKAGGGGGGGGLVFFKCNELLKKGEYPITIGMGGAGGSGIWTCAGANGGDTIFNGYIAYGGGGGASATDCYSVPRGPAGDGGNGGGAGGYCGSACNCMVGRPVSNMGHMGGAANNSYGGGGGGALNQGRGICNCISGAYCYYGGGGNGGGGYEGLTNSYGGGNGGGCDISGGNGKRYGGGGGGGGYCSGLKGGSGYQGVVIISYPEACNYNIIGGTITCCNGNKIHTFTTNGTLCIN